MTEAQKPTGISRRTIVKAAAWSVPVIAVGPALPAFAATGFFQLDGKACKLPGNATDTFKGYAFGITATNTTAADITINIISLTLDGTDLGDVLVIQTDPNNAAVCTAFPVNTITIPAGQTLTNLVALTQRAANSQQGELVVEYSIAGQPGTVTGSAPVTPPIVGGSCRDFTTAQKDCLTNFVALAPTITGFSPVAGPSGTQVTITGTNLLDSTVYLGTEQSGSVMPFVGTPTENQVVVEVPSFPGAIPGVVYQLLVVNNFGSALSTDTFLVTLVT